MKWYADGLRFECLQCGSCCRPPSEGHVWLSEHEIEDIADHAGCSVDETWRYFLHCIGDRPTILNRKDHSCIFLDDTQCFIYPARPVQCRTWPFWPANLRSPSAWEHAKKRCQGIGRGPLIPFEDIETQRRATETLFT